MDILVSKESQQFEWAKRNTKSWFIKEQLVEKKKNYFFTPLGYFWEMINFFWFSQQEWKLTLSLETSLETFQGWLTLYLIGNLHCSLAELFTIIFLIKVFKFDFISKMKLHLKCIRTQAVWQLQWKVQLPSNPHVAPLPGKKGSALTLWGIISDVPLPNKYRRT